MKHITPQQWEQCIGQARLISASRHASQLKIAELALEVCEVSWGGQKKGQDNGYTLSRFAEEIGIAPKTLSAWIAIKVNVYDRLDSEMRAKASFTDMSAISKKVNRDTTTKDVMRIARKRIYANAFDQKLLRYAAGLRSLAHNFEKQNAVLRASENVLGEIKFFCTLIVDHIDEHRPGIEAKDIGLTETESKARKDSAARALGLPRNVLITKKDQSVIDYLKKKNDFTSPTEIGMKIGGHNESSASGWALRTLYKLGDKVKKNDRGHYKLVV